ncbi:MAG: nuclear transport factor 2 family protein [Ahniella sp.]|nr:nuclear transport factor 2 family protein [Ahniella sp.]
MSAMTPHHFALNAVERYYACFNDGDHAGMLALLADDIAHDINQGKRETGREAFARFLKRMDAHYQERVVDLVVMASEDGSRAAAEFRILGRYLRTDEGLPEARGQNYDLPVGAFFALADGHITRVSNHYNLQDWIAQVHA